ncbi:MAG: DHH family phosphoesterase, partial [archaeon]
MQKSLSNLSKLKGKKVLLLCHENADLDSFCSAAMMQAYLKSKRIKSTLAIPSHINDQALHFAYANKVSFEMNPNLAGFEVVMLFDLNDFHQLGSLSTQFSNFCINKCQEIMVFDHHEPKKGSISCAAKSFKAFTSTSCVSTTHLLYSILGKDKSFTKDMAFFACIGMIEDTGRFLVGSADSFAAFADCLNRSKKSYAQVLAFTKHEIPEAERVAFLKAAQRAEIIDINDIIVVSSILSFYQSSAATKLLEFGAQITLV